MEKIEAYRQHARECRDMARTAPAAHRDQLETMAKTWEQLAEFRKRQLDKCQDSPALVVEFEIPEDEPSKH
jgi:hypothetical protein